MQSKETKIFTVEGKNVRFNAKIFNRSFITYARNNKKKIGDLEELLAERIGVTKDAVHNWRFEKNGPSDIEMIKIMAEVLCIKNWTIFTKSSSEGEKIMQLTERQMDALKRVYDGIVEFLFEFERTDGFNNYWFEYSQGTKREVQDLIFDRVERKVDNLYLLLDKEYFDLGRHEIYDALCEYVNEDIYELFNGKLSYAYRFEAVVEGNPTTSEDYNKAMTAINSIIEKYI